MQEQSNLDVELKMKGTNGFQGLNFSKQKQFMKIMSTSLFISIFLSRKKKTSLKKMLNNKKIKSMKNSISLAKILNQMQELTTM